MPNLCSDCRNDRPKSFYAHLNDPVRGKETSSCIRCRIKRLTWYELKHHGDDPATANRVRDVMTHKVISYADQVWASQQHRRLTDKEFLIALSGVTACRRINRWRHEPQNPRPDSMYHNQSQAGPSGPSGTGQPFITPASAVHDTIEAPGPADEDNDLGLWDDELRALEEEDLAEAQAQAQAEAQARARGSASSAPGHVVSPSPTPQPVPIGLEDRQIPSAQTERHTHSQGNPTPRSDRQQPIQHAGLVTVDHRDCQAMTAKELSKLQKEMSQTHREFQGSFMEAVFAGGRPRMPTREFAERAKQYCGLVKAAAEEVKEGASGGHVGRNG